MIEKKIRIDGEDCMMRSSALIPKLYRAKFGRDMVRDMQSLAKAYKKVKELPEDATEDEIQAAQFDVVDLEIFERVAWIMLKHAGNEIPDDPDDWLMSLNGVFSIYEVLPEIMDLWNMNNKTTSVPRKK